MFNIHLPHLVPHQRAHTGHSGWHQWLLQATLRAQRALVGGGHGTMRSDGVGQRENHQMSVPSSAVDLLELRGWPNRAHWAAVERLSGADAARAGGGAGRPEPRSGSTTGRRGSLSVDTHLEWDVTKAFLPSDAPETTSSCARTGHLSGAHTRQPDSDRLAALRTRVAAWEHAQRPMVRGPLVHDD